MLATVLGIAYGGFLIWREDVGEDSSSVREPGLYRLKHEAVDSNKSRCKQGQGRCIDKSDWEELCKRISGITVLASRMSTYDSFRGDFRDDLHYLEQNGGLQNLKTYTKARKPPFEQENEYCWSEITIEGMYKGSSVSKIITGYVGDIVVTNEGKVLIAKTTLVEVD